ncbi:MAG: diguanylate cyclase domain-containing protein [Pseudomonadota bacterium]
MKQLLLVEDSRLFAQAVERELAVNNIFATRTATTMAEARELLATETFFAAISDLQLPDASDGEVVPELLEKELPVIVLTGRADGPVRERINELPLVDYVVKNSVNDITYAARLAELLVATRGMGTLMVGFDQAFVERAELLFGPLGLVSEYSEDAVTIEAAMEGLSVDLVLIDHDATGEQGLSLLRALRRRYSTEQLPILLATEQHDPALEAQLLKAGASDFLIKPFSREEFTARILNLLGTLERFRQVSRYAETVDRYVITSTTDERGRILTASQAFCDISGYSKEELIGRDHNIVRHPDMPDALYADLWRTITSGRTWEGEVKNLRKDGGYYWVHVHIEPRFDREGVIIGYVAVRQDITDKKRIEWLSITDAMTGLYNRRHLAEIFDRVVAEAVARSQVYGFILFDVDKFKQYNDHYGHQAGDDVLVTVGELMSERTGDEVSAFRLGGEEFAFFGRFETADDVGALAERFRQALQDRGIVHACNEAAEVVTASFGLALASGRDGLDELYKRADEALYEAKEAGRNRVVRAPEAGNADGS